MNFCESAFLKKHSMHLTNQRNKRTLGITTVTVIIAVVVNLNALIDLILHPEIEYFDIEHIIVGSATGIVVGIILIVLRNYIEIAKDIFGNATTSEKALLESESRYKLLAENISDVIWIYDLESHRFRYISPSVFRLRGFTVEEAMNQKIEESVTPSSFERINANITDRIQQFLTYGSQSHADIVEQICKDGSTVWVEIRTQFGKNAESGHMEVYGVSRNITERKKSEDAMRESEIRLLRAEQFARFGHWQYSIDEKIMRASDSAVCLYGFVHNEVPLSEVQAVVLPEYRPMLDRSLMELIEHNRPYDVEFKIRRISDGSIVDIHSKAEYNAQTKTVFGIVQDITERKKAMEELRESEEIFNQLMEHSPIYVFFKDQHIRATKLSRNFEKMLGHPINELLGKSMDDLFPSDLAKSMICDDMKILNEGKRVEVEEELNGQYYLTIKFPVNVDGKPRYLAGFTIDITERKKSQDALQESENRFRKILQDVQTVAVQGYAPDGTTQYWNQASELLYGYTAEEAIGRNLLDLIIPPEMRSNVAQAIKQMEETGEPIPASELSLLRKDGTRVSVFSSHTIVHIPGRSQELFCIDVDLTERKRSEEALRNAQKLESIGTLAGGIAHDFNNLLGAMMGNISLAQSRLSPDHPAVNNIKRAISAMERAATLTKQMLAYSGKGKFQIREIDLCSLVQEHINLFEVTLPKNVQLISKLSDTPVHIKGDPGQIEQIVMNLIINGGEAIGKKQGTVLIEISSVTMGQDKLGEFSVLTNRTLKNGSYALITVTDNGSGMNKETIEKIFDPFFTTKFLGRGLGLSAVLGIIRGNEGGIAIESTEGIGTTFKVLLPLIHYTDMLKNISDARNQSPIVQNIKILIIDDEQYILEMAVDILEYAKYTLLSSADPEKGIALFEEQWQSIDVVLLDYSMPKMNGNEVLIELRKINPEVKVIITSGYTEEEIVELMGDDAPNSFIQKPYTQENLLSVVKRILESA